MLVACFFNHYITDFETDIATPHQLPPPSIELTPHQASAVVGAIVLLAAVFLRVGQQGEAVATQPAAAGQAQAGETLKDIHLKNYNLG